MDWIANILSGVSDITGKFIPDQTKKLEFEAQIKGLLNKVDLAQIGVNLEEAKSESLFKSGWRPAVGWVCTLAFGLNFLIFPLLSSFGIPVVTLDIEAVLGVLGGLLGIGTLRTVDKRLKGK